MIQVSRHMSPIKIGRKQYVNRTREFKFMLLILIY